MGELRFTKGRTPGKPFFKIKFEDLNVSRREVRIDVYDVGGVGQFEGWADLRLR